MSRTSLHISQRRLVMRTCCSHQQACVRLSCVQVSAQVASAQAQRHQVNNENAMVQHGGPSHSQTRPCPVWSLMHVSVCAGCVHPSLQDGWCMTRHDLELASSMAWYQAAAMAIGLFTMVVVVV